MEVSNRLKCQLTIAVITLFLAGCKRPKEYFVIDDILIKPIYHKLDKNEFYYSKLDSSMISGVEITIQKTYCSDKNTKRKFLWSAEPGIEGLKEGAIFEISCIDSYGFDCSNEFIARSVGSFSVAPKRANNKVYLSKCSLPQFVEMFRRRDPDVSGLRYDNFPIQFWLDSTKSNVKKTPIQIRAKVESGKIVNCILPE